MVHMATDRSSTAVFQWVLGSDGVRWQAGMVEVLSSSLAGGLPVMDRLGRTVRGAHSRQSRMAGGQFTLWVNIPWCVAERLVATG